jgi:hypothetical protein
MDGLFYLMSVVGVGIVMWWVMQNDRVPPDKPTVGMFAMFTGAELARRRGLRGLLANADTKPLRRAPGLDRPASPQDLMR